MRFRLTPRSMTLDDLELYKFEFLENFSGFLKISNATTAKWMKIDQYCQQQRCKHVELEQFLACFRVMWVCQRQLGFLAVYSVFPSVLWYSWLSVLTCKNRLPCNLYGVSGDVKPCSIQSNPLILYYSWESAYFLCCQTPPKRHVVRGRNLTCRRVTTMCRTSVGFYVFCL